MAVKLRLQRKGRKGTPFYFIVATDARRARGGKFIDKLGTYNPLAIPAAIDVDRDKALSWLHKGAQPTNTVRRILSFKGVMYWKHLLRGVSLGLFDLPTAESKFKEWNSKHEVAVREKQERTRKHKQELLTKVWEQSSALKRTKSEEKAKAAQQFTANQDSPDPANSIDVPSEDSTPST